jgi:hypothetical protein
VKSEEVLAVKIMEIDRQQSSSVSGSTKVLDERVYETGMSSFPTLRLKPHFWGFLLGFLG